MAGGIGMVQNQPVLKSQKLRPSRKHPLEYQKREFLDWYRAMEDTMAYFDALLEDAKNILPSYTETDKRRDANTLKKRIKHEGVQFATVTLPSLFDGLTHYLEKGKSVYPGFKIKSGCEYPVFLQRLFAQVYSVEATEEDETTAIQLLYQIAVLFKKVKGPYPHKVLLKQAEDFVQVDKSIGYIDLESECLAPILEHARAIVNSIFDGFDPFRNKYVLPNPGPGATNTKVEKHLRYEPHVLYDQINETLPYKEWFYMGPTGFHNDPARSFRSLLKTRRSMPTSRYKQVPKVALKPRGICIEENEMQFMQQAIKNGLYNWIEHHPITSGFVNFAKQTINQYLALRASKNRQKATLDESEASDRVLRMLVSYLFRDQEKLNECLMSLSTRIITFPDEFRIPPLVTNKFAPMGSALCFPVMAIVNFALCKAIILQSNVKRRFSLSKEVYVYGDDIVVPSSCVQAIYDWLPMFGFKINQSKSFVSSHFRESCGLHAYKGVDITPVYMRCIPNSKASTEALASSLATEELFFNKGFFNMAELLRQRITRIWGPLPYVHWKSSIAGYRRKDPTDFAHVKTYASKVRKMRPRKDGPDYQCQEYRFRCLRVPPKGITKDIMSENSRYLYKMVTGTREANAPSSDTSKLQVHWCWLLDSQLTTEVF